MPGRAWEVVCVVLTFRVDMHVKILICSSYHGFRVECATYAVQVDTIKCVVIQKAVFLRSDI